MPLLREIVVLLAAAVVLIPLFKYLKFGTVLGYLAAGVIVGPFVLGLITDISAMRDISEFGVVLLLFLIGLELQPSRLWILRRAVFGLGLLQMLSVGAALALGLAFLGFDWKLAILIGLTLAMSSTALVLPTLSERKELTAHHGRDAFAILLFQDLAVIPLLALLPKLAPTMAAESHGNIVLQVSAIVALIAAGRYLVRPFFHTLARMGGREIFTAGALLVVVAVALLMEAVGLSMTLGAFLAGVMLADSEYRHEIESAIDPFESMLLGLFFMAVGMSANLGLLVKAPLLLAGGALGLILVKAIVLYVLRRMFKGEEFSARMLAISLAQGGEFGFVVFALMAQGSLIEQKHADLFIMIITLSMIATPFLFLIIDKVHEAIRSRTEPPPFDAFDEPGNPVVIAGFGRVGQIVGRLISARKVKFTALDVSPEQVEFVRKFGNKVYYGDASQLTLLHAAKVGEAKVFVLAIDDVEASVKTALLMKRHFPHVPIIARARNRLHAYRLIDIGVDEFIRETHLSSLEMAKQTLIKLGLDEQTAKLSVERFNQHDRELLIRQQSIYQDEKALIASGRQGREELQSLFDSDTDFSEKSAG
ncbi:MAG: monovalent cation:proton antiporter-2 (CPA2) family protein [Burkholderiales bacterium]